MIEPKLVASAVAAIAGLGVALSAAELLLPNSALNTFYHWKLTRTRFARSHALARLSRYLTRDAVLKPLIALQAVCALLSPLLLWRDSAAAPILLVTILLVAVAVRQRLPFGLDGSDQMQSLLWLALLLFSLAQGDLGRGAALSFIAAQLILAYVTSGVAKLASPRWRSGLAISDVLYTQTYGNPNVAKLIRRWRLERLVAWSTMLFETFGPLCLLGDPPLVIAFIVGGVTLHLSIALIMGLNSFFFAFCATLPAAFWLARVL